MNETLRRTWPIVLVVVVALLYLWVGIAAHGWDQVLALGGGLVILGAVAVARRSFTLAIALLVIGALPLAIATWSLAPVAFAIWTTANLAPRALSNHRWYRQQFPDYPSERRALVPYVL